MRTVLIVVGVILLTVVLGFAAIRFTRNRVNPNQPFIPYTNPSSVTTANTPSGWNQMAINTTSNVAAKALNVGIDALGKWLNQKLSGNPTPSPTLSTNVSGTQTIRV